MCLELVISVWPLRKLDHAIYRDLFLFYLFIFLFFFFSEEKFEKFIGKKLLFRTAKAPTMYVLDQKQN